MKITCVIPVYNYVEGLFRISDWIQKDLSKLVNDYEVIVFNDKSNSIYQKDFDKIAKRPKFKVINSRVNTKNLKIPFEIAAKNAIDKRHDAVFITESDAVPDTVTFMNMLNVYNNPFRTPRASVSPMYKWNNKFCYPTSNHWFKDGLNNKLGRKKYVQEGNVSTVGGSGVPFLFSLWNPLILKDINRLEFPNMLSLDSKFGQYCHKKGYHHLRLLDNSVGHYGGGQKSWKNTPKSNNAKEVNIRPTKTERRKPTIKRNNTINKSKNLIIDESTVVFPKVIDTEINTSKKIAVLIHFYYIDLWKEFDLYLKKIKSDFDLYINLVEGSTDIVNLINFKKTILKKYPNAKVFISDNKGMDIGGTFNILEYILKIDKRYDLFLKLHSKKSIHSASEEHGNTWRKELIKPLLDNSIMSMFDNNSIGMVGSKKWHIKTRINKRLTFMSNLQFIKQYHKLLKLKLTENDIEFIGGTMFWISGDIIYKTFTQQLLINIRNEFEYGKFTDHNSPSRTHAFERIFGSIVISLKKKIIGV